MSTTRKVKITRDCDYMATAVYHPARILRRARKTLKDKRYDTLVGTGLSGALVLPMLAKGLKKNYVVVRKKGDESHSDMPAEGILGRRWVFVDDFISTGRTKRRVVRAIKYIANGLIDTKLVGSFLYRESGGRYEAEE